LHLELRNNDTDEHIQDEEAGDKDVADKQDSYLGRVPAHRGFVYLGRGVNGCVHEIRPHFERGHFEHNLHTLENIVVVPTRLYPLKTSRHAFSLV
jgi:hypothetical protein